jgi:hypothetical protein
MFLFFELYCARWASKLVKNANENFFLYNILIWVEKIAEFDADFKSVEKKSKKFPTKNLLLA